jgi:hypothetical protein
MKTTADLRNSVFEIVFDSMCGDGEAYVLCENWEEAADSFELWLDGNHAGIFNRTDRGGSVTFSCEQDLIVFSDPNADTPVCPDCIIILPKL